MMHSVLVYFRKCGDIGLSFTEYLVALPCLLTILTIGAPFGSVSLSLLSFAILLVTVVD